MVRVLEKFLFSSCLGLLTATAFAAEPTENVPVEKNAPGSPVPAVAGSEKMKSEDVLLNNSPAVGSTTDKVQKPDQKPIVQPKPKVKRWYRREKAQGTKAQKRFKKNPVIKSVYRNKKGRRYDVDPD